MNTQSTAKVDAFRTYSAMEQKAKKEKKKKPNKRKLVRVLLKGPRKMQF